MLYFLAELAVYVSVSWWGFTQDSAAGIRGLLGLGTIVVFAAAWAAFAAPRAAIPLRGMAIVAFKLAWFGLGAAAGLVVMLGR